MRVKVILWLAVGALCLTACQQNDLFDGEITAIEVQEWDSGEEVTILTDKSLLENLAEELESASTTSTANMDIPHPDYRLLFYAADGTEELELGYYNEDMNFDGPSGRYIDFGNGEHFGVTTELPLEGD